MAIDIAGYKILRTLGKGGMATVYLAEQEIFERQVALKVMSKSLAEDPAFGQRFMREAKIVSQLVHPNIVNVHDVGMHDGQYYLAMQFIDGQDLKLVKNSLSLQKKINAIRDIAKALDYAGSKGYIHRDIKPENILFDSSDGRAILTDFGIAKAAESDLAMTQTGTAIGTPHYMSPEQAKGLTVDKRADIYSLGVVFFLLLTGNLPYDAQSAVAIGIKHITEPVPLLPAELNSLQHIIDKMMAKRVSERYQTASEVVFALDDIDMSVLEHAVQMAVQVGSTQTIYSSNAETEVATSASIDLAFSDRDGTGAEFPKSDAPRLGETQRDFTVVYNTDELETRSHGIIWFVGLCVLFSVIGWVIYNQYPKQVDNLIVDAKSSMSGLFGGQNTQSSASNNNAQNSEAKKDKVQAIASQSKPAIQSNAQEPFLSNMPEPFKRDGEITKQQSAITPQTPPLSDSALNENIIVDTNESLISGTEPINSSAVGPTISELDNTITTTGIEGEDSPVSQQTFAEPLSEEVLAAQKQVDYIKERFSQNPALLEQLVQAYRELLVVQPSNVDAPLALEALKENAKERVMIYAQEEKFTLANKVLESIEQSFSSVSEQELLDLKNTVSRKEKVASLISKANNYFKAGKLTKPIGDNALETFLQVQELDPDNERAKVGLTQTGLKLIEYAQQHYDNGKLDVAMRMVDQALIASPDLNSAKALLRKIQYKQEQMKTLDDLLRKAKIAQNNQHYYHPRSGSAFSYYRQALEIDERNQQAKQGLVEVYSNFKASIDELIVAENYVEAKNKVIRAQKAGSQSERLPGLAAKMLPEIEQKIIETTPTIGLIAVTSQPIMNLTSNGSDMIAVDNELHVAFTYKGFKAESMTVQATLLDGKEQLQFGQQPVLLSNKAGKAQFVFQKPNQGFTSGQYVLYLRFGEEVLKRYEFKINNG